MSTWWPAAVVPLLLLSGCATASRPDVESSVTSFYAAYEQRDGAKACALLAPAVREEVARSTGTSCERGLLSERLPSVHPVRSTSIAGDQAQVRLGSDTAFVARFPSGWKVTAVGCTRRPGAPYDCQVEAG
jgi:hypothetical protein